MGKQRRVLGAKFKAKVALAAVRGAKTLSQLASEFGIHGNQVSAWRRKLLSDAAELCEDGRKQASREEASAEDLYEQLGRLKMELEWLKKKSAATDTKRSLVEPEHARISGRRQCQLLGLARSSYCWESAENLRWLRLLDEEPLRHPFYGPRRLADYLCQTSSQPIKRKRVQRSMRLMGIEAIYPRPRATPRKAGHRIFPC